jgi:hypothetical protein
MKILDCTIGDGGYYTYWDFDQNLITEYCKSMEKLPIDYIEVGYRSIPMDGYLESVSIKVFVLANENNYLIEKFMINNFKLVSLTETIYNVELQSIYKLN